MTGLPATWCAASLSDICEPIVDGSHNPPKGIEKGFAMLIARNISNHQIVFDDFRWISGPDFQTENARTRVSTGDVSLTIVGTIGRTAVVPENVVPFALQRSVAVLKPAGVNARYLAYAIDSPSQQQWLIDNAKGTAQKGVYLGVLGASRIPFAPTNEQARIVDKLEELLSDLDAGVAELKSAQKKLAQYRQSLLKAAVEGRLTEAWRAQRGEPEESGAQLLARILRERRLHWETKQLAKFESQGKVPANGWQEKYSEPAEPDTRDLPGLPEGWQWASLDQLASMVRNGLSQKPDADSSGYPILRINAVRTMAVNLAEVRFLSLTAKEAADYLLDEGDLLATRYNGSVDLLGVVGVVRGLKSPTVYPDKLIRIKPVLKSGLADWIEVCPAVGASRAHVVSRVKTTAGQTGISGDDIKKVPIPLAPISEQFAAIEIISSAFVEIASQEASVAIALRQSAAQRKNILRAAFSGQLVPQDPNDEPASVLLERIRGELAQRATLGKPGAGKTRAAV